MDKIILPKIGNQVETLETFNLLEETMLSQASISGHEVSQFNASYLKLDEMYIEKTVFHDVSIRFLDSVDVVFDNCQFINCEFMGSSLVRVQFRKCRCIGTNFSESNFNEVLFEQALVEMCSFYYMKAKSWQFVDCIIRSCDFYESEVKALGFYDTELKNSVFNKIALAGVDFRSCELESMQVSIDSLKGCIVTPSQALSFASLLGIDIREEWV